MPNQQILDYIAHAKSQDIKDEAIQNALFKAGWPRDEVMEAFAPKPPQFQAPPAPIVPQTHIGMWVGFLYILYFISLYVLATSIGGLLHGWVDKLIPDPANVSGESSWFDFMIPVYVAALIVSYPIFAGLAIMLKKQVQKNPAIKNLRSRKILIYITLIGTFILMISDIIKTLYFFLTGAFSLNALGNLGVTFLVSGYIFYYFLTEVRADKNT